MSNFNAISKCPNCHANQLMIDEQGNYVCRACDQVFTAAQIEGTTSANEDALAVAVSAAIRDIDSPDAALIYLETYFAAFDWKKYASTPDIYIEDIRVMVEKNKIKRPGDNKTWQLEATSILIPLQKKIEAIKALEDKILDKYKGDIASVTHELTRYNSLVVALKRERDNILRVFEADLANMQRFGAAMDDVALIECKIAEIKPDLEAFEYVTDVEDLPEFKAVSAANEDAVIKKYSSKGINAPSLYNQGVHAYNEKRYSEAAQCFEDIREYKDSLKYIRFINRFYLFGEIVEAGGKLYKSAPHKEMAATGCGKKNKPAPETKISLALAAKIVKTFDFYEIKDGKPAEHPSIYDVAEVISSYGDNIYYIKGKDKFCVFNTTNSSERILDVSKFGYTTNDKDCMGYTFDRTKLYIRKVLDVPKFNKGCAVGKFAKRKEEEFNKGHQNNYSLLLVDLRDGHLSVPVEKLVSCICLRDYAFFTVSEVVGEGKHHSKIYENKAKVHNFATGITEVLFEKNCEILAVSGDNVIYDTWLPNSLNRELRVINYKTREDVLLESNVYEFIEIGGDRVLYTVGNYKHSSLYAINLDGTGRREVLSSFHSREWDVDADGDWLNMTRGSLIMRVSLETDDKIVLAVDVNEIVKISGNFLYYISTNGTFRIVRLDGNNNVAIAPDLNADDISVSTNDVYYIRREWVGHKWSNSLYRMDPDGHNVKKVLFNIERMKDKDDYYASMPIFILKKEMRDYRVKPGKKEKDAFIESFEITTYYSFDKISGEKTPLLVLGVPTAETYKKKGCALFKKNVTIEEVESVIDYGQFTEAEGKALDLSSTIITIGGKNKGNGCGASNNNKKNSNKKNNAQGCGGSTNKKSANKAQGCGAPKK